MFEMTPLDHVVNAGKAVLSGFGGPGAAAASLIGDYGPRSIRRSLAMFAEKVQENFRSIQERLDVGGVKQEEFWELFTSCYFSVLRTTREEKISAASALLFNLMLKKGDDDKLPYGELEHFAKVLDRLSSGAVCVLGVIWRNAKSVPQELFKSGIQKTHQFDKLRGQLERIMPGITPEFLHGLLSELSSANLVQSNVYGIRTDEYASAMVELTPLGQRFVEYVLEWPPKETDENLTQ